jgi:methionyl-tRNA formyltransferase
MNIILFGNVPLASWLIERVIESDSLNLMGVVCEEYSSDSFVHHGMHYPGAYAFCKKNSIEILSYSDAGSLARQNPVFGVSVRYNIIFEKEYFELFQPGIVNLHGGELPRFRGTNIANHAILEAVDKGAGTIHFIANGVDTGDIVERVYFEVSEEDTAQIFFNKTLRALQIAAINMLDKIDAGASLERISQDELIRKGEFSKEYKKKDLYTLKEVSIDDIKTGYVLRKIKAFTFRGHKSAYFLIDGQKVYLNLEAR